MAQTRVRYGYRKIRVLLNREGWAVSKHLVYRLYREEGVTLRHRPPRRRKAVGGRAHRPPVTRPNDAWTLDVVADQLVTGHRFRALTVGDGFTRESLTIEVGQHLRGEHVITVLTRLTAQRGAPTWLWRDRGSEFCSQLVDLWASQHQVRIDFSRPGTPTDHAHVESFNATLRRACLNAHWFESLQEAKERIEAWRRAYNERRPHRALWDRTPAEFAKEVALNHLGELFTNVGDSP